MSTEKTQGGPEAHDAPISNYYDRLSNAELTGHYLSARRKFRDLIKKAERISMGSAGTLSTDNRMFWASVLFTRVVVTAKSVNRLLPDPKPREHWDFSAAASLVRNLQEATLVYYWLCGGEITEEVREGRIILMNLHDHGSRRRLFSDGLSEPDEICEDLVRRFDANPYLTNFSPQQRKAALKGQRTPFLQDEVLSEMNVDLDAFRVVYRFFSQHTHTGPIAFYRLLQHDRGTGVETRMEKIYMLFAVDTASSTLTAAISEHLKIFPDAETRPPYLTRRQIEANVEIERRRQNSVRRSR